MNFKPRTGSIVSYSVQAPWLALRNDSLIAVAETPANKPHIKAPRELPKSHLYELEQFLVNYSRVQGREFRLIGRGGPQPAERLLNAAMRAYQKRT